MVLYWKIQSFSLGEICTVIPLAGQWYGNGKSRKFYWNTVGQKFQIGNAYSLTEKKDLFLSVFVNDIKLAGKKQNIDPMWNVLVKKSVDLGRTDISR